MIQSKREFSLVQSEEIDFKIWINFGVSTCPTRDMTLQRTLHLTEAPKKLSRIH